MSGANIAIGVATPTIFQATKAVAVLRREKLSPEAINNAGEMAAAQETGPIADLRSTAGCRRQTAEVLVRRAAEKALE